MNGGLRENYNIHNLSASVLNLKEAVAQMPAERVAKMNAGALSAIEKEIRKLLEQIQPENVALAEALAKQLQYFGVDKLIDLTSHV